MAILSNVAYIAAMMPIPHTGRGFDIVSLYELPERLNNAITAPTESDPIAVRTSHTTMTLYPTTLSGATVMYYKYPEQAVVAYTRNSTTLRPEYDSVNSIELEWDDMNKIDIAYMILRDAGVNIERRDVAQYADQLIKSGK